MKRHVALIAVLTLVAFGLQAAPAAKSGKSTKALPRITATGSAIGAFLGQPTGLTFRSGLSATESLEFKAAWSLGSSSSLAFQANWITEFPGVLVVSGEDIVPYLGGGLALGVGTGQLGLGLRMPLGLVYRFRQVPLELALEVGLGLSLLPSTDLYSSGGLALRYRF